MSVESKRDEDESQLAPSNDNSEDGEENFEDASEGPNLENKKTFTTDSADVNRIEQNNFECKTEREHGDGKDPRLPEGPSTSNHGDDKKIEMLKRRKEVEEELSQKELEDRKMEADSLKRSANELYLRGESQEAIQLYSQALDVCPLCYTKDRAIFFSNRAAALLQLSLKEEALEDCCEAVSLNPHYLKALTRRAGIYEDIDRPHEALKDVESILKLDPRHPESLAAILRLPDKIRVKDEKLKTEMLDNLKKLGNMCLKPFGLSTDNFKMVQDPNTGGYNINFSK